MGIATTVIEFLDRTGVDYSVIQHPHSPSSMRTAEAAHVSGEFVAKGVLLKDAEGYVLAVVPASHHVQVGHVQEKLGRPLETAPEPELAEVFPDCEPGAVPAVGPAYDLDTIIDPSLQGQPDIYFEAGDHEELIHVTGEVFESLLQDAQFMQCSEHRP